MKLPARVLGHVVLLEDTHALLDLVRNLHDVNLGESLVLSGRIPTFVGPVACGQDFDVEIDAQHLATLTLLEVKHALLRHFDIFEHHFEPLRELESALFL